MLTHESSAVILTFTPPTAPTAQPRFEAWRETWHRQVLADRRLGHRDKSVAGLLLWYLNRQVLACFPSYSTIAAGVGISRRDAMRSIAMLVKCGHLLRQPRVRKTNYYSPQVVAPCHQGGGTAATRGGGKLDTLTSDLEPLTRTCSRSALSESTNGNQVQTESAGGTSGTKKKEDGRRLAFDGGVVKVTADQLARWRRAYPLVPDMVAELRLADDHFIENPSNDGKWLFRASAWLKRENNARLKERRATELDEDSW